MVTHNRSIFPVRSPEDMGGMTLLEYYAGQALIGLLSADHSSKELYPGSRGVEFEGDEAFEDMARLAWAAAEAMLRTHPEH